MTSGHPRTPEHWTGLRMPTGERVEVKRPHVGFTLIELLVVLAVLAILAGMAVPLYLDRVEEARETALRHNLIGLRQVIDQFHRDKGRYPAALEELVKSRYLRSIPEDPITRRSDTWVTVLSVDAGGAGDGIFDVRSGASGKAKDGSAYAQW